MSTRIDTEDHENGKVAAVVVSYNHAQFISDTLRSVLEQTYYNIEVVVADDGSTDGTQEIIKQFAQANPAKFRLALNPENTGIASNFNRALDLCSGDFIAWLGGDDMWLPEKISKQVAYMRTHPEVAGCHADAELFVSDTGKSLGLFSEIRGQGAGQLPEGGVEVLFDVRTPMLPSTMMVRTEITRGHRFDERLKYANDWLFDIEIFRNNRIGAIGEVLARQRRHDNNVSSRTRLDSTGIEDMMIVLAITIARYPELLPLVRMRRSSLYLSQMVRAIQKNDPHRARAFLRASLKEGHKLRSTITYVVLLLGGWRIISALEGNLKLESLIRKFIK